MTNRGGIYSMNGSTHRNFEEQMDLSVTSNGAFMSCGAVTLQYNSIIYTSWATDGALCTVLVTLQKICQCTGAVSEEIRTLPRLEH